MSDRLWRVNYLEIELSPGQLSLVSLRDR